MKFLFATNETIQLGCRKYRKEYRYYENSDIVGTGKTPDGKVHPAMRPLHHSFDCYPDGTFVAHNYYLMPSNERVTDTELIDKLNAEGNYGVEGYIVKSSWCLRTPDNRLIRVCGYEKRRNCDDVTVLYQEWHVKNSADPKYHVGDVLYSLRDLEKTRCIGCCGKGRGDAITIN